MANLDLYNNWRSVPPEACRQFSNGSFSGTDINPMWRIKKLTEQFGACGIGWYYEVLSERAETYGNTVMAIVDLNLYIKVGGEWSKPIYGTGGNLLVRETKNGSRPSDEGYKMALTDALSVACKALGIGADVYFSSDRTKYTAQEPKISQDKIEKLQTNSKKVYGEEWAIQLSAMMAKYGVNTLDDITESMYERIAQHMKDDWEVKKGANQ